MKKIITLQFLAILFWLPSMAQGYGNHGNDRGYGRSNNRYEPYNHDRRYYGHPYYDNRRERDDDQYRDRDRHRDDGHGRYDKPGCSFQMDERSFQGLLRNLDMLNFESEKLATAEMAAQGGRMSSDQVRTILGRFDFESTRMEFAEFAYPYVIDPGNYYTINEAFVFASSRMELYRFINRHSR